jgi:diguanylate cyclase (GGDEF)-like protein
VRDSTAEQNPPDPPARSEATDLRIRRTWWFFAGSFFLLGVAIVLRLLAGEPAPLDWLLGALVVVTGLGAVLHRDAVRTLEAGRRAEAESFARILSALSRSISPDAIVDAIVEELGAGARADHIVVVRRRVDARVLEARLVTRRPGVPDSTTILPIADLEDPAEALEGSSSRRPSVTIVRPGAETSGRVAGVDPSSAVGLVVERLSSRARSVYGLSHTLAAPLQTEAGLIGAIVLSRRMAGAWPAATRRILAGAAVEASAALSRAYSHRAAEALASTDPLTGLPNRRYFDEFCALLARRRRLNDRVGILMVDIDKFKALNDRHGHAVGDQVLRGVASAIASAVREDDVPARYGGEEFVVLLRNPSPEIALEVGERVREAVGSLDLRRIGVGSVSVSVGVAVARTPDQAIDELQHEADRALYEAKRRGRDRVVAA